MNMEVLSISGEALQKAREDFDGILKATLKRMKSLRLKQGTVALTVTITTEDGFEDDTEVTYPKFDYKVKSKMAIQGEAKGIIAGQLKIAELYDPETGEVNTYIAEQNMNMDELAEGQLGA